jgi:hypothetical protein
LNARVSLFKQIGIYLPIGCRERHAREDPSLLRWSVSRQTKVPNRKANVSFFPSAHIHFEPLLVGADYCISSEVEPAALEIRIEVWLFLAVSIGVRRIQAMRRSKAVVMSKLDAGNNHTGERL